MDLKESLKYLKLRESTISLIIGVFVIALSGGLLYRYFVPNAPEKIADTFINLQIGEVTPNLSPALPSDAVTAVSPVQTPTLNNPTNTTSTSTEATKYTVKEGDSLWTISEAHFKSGYNWTDIAEANKITNPGIIEAGQEIFIPNVNPKTPTTTLASANMNQSSISGESYTVETGDSLWNIAVRAYGDGFKWREIASENNISTPNLIYPATSLKIPRNS